MRPSKRGAPETEKTETFGTFVLKEGLVFLLVLAGLITMAFLLPIPHETVARPSDTSYVPRPEWYFLFLFELLKFFPGEWEVVGVVVVPGVAMLVLFLLPFVDRSAARGIQRRPLAAAAVTVVLSSIIFLTYRAISTTPPTMSSQEQLVLLGKGLYQKQGCSNCHAINGEGGTFGPDLAGLRERRTLSWTHRYLEDPLSLNPNSQMPGYLGSLSHEGVEAVSLYLLSLTKGEGVTIPPPDTGGGETDVANGENIFQQKCSFCHNLGGIGGLLSSGNIGSDEQIRDIIRQGGQVMPAFGKDKISDSELEDLIAYLETLQ